MSERGLLWMFLYLLTGPAFLFVVESQDTYRQDSNPNAAQIQVVFGRLLDRIPMEYPVDLDLGYGGDEHGVLDWDEGEERFTIGINAEACCLAVALDTLLEEYAHILVYDAYQTDDHDALWGVAYARCVRVSR